MTDTTTVPSRDYVAAYAALARAVDKAIANERKIGLLITALNAGAPDTEPMVAVGDVASWQQREAIGKAIVGVRDAVGRPNPGRRSNGPTRMALDADWATLDAEQRSRYVAAVDLARNALLSYASSLRAKSPSATATGRSSRRFA